MSATQTIETREDSRDRLLIEAWKRMLGSGDLSDLQRQRYTRLREIVIVLSVFTTFFAVLSGLGDILSDSERWLVTVMLILTIFVLIILNTTFTWLRQVGIMWYMEPNLNRQATLVLFTRTAYTFGLIIASSIFSYYYLLEPTFNFIAILPLTLEALLRFIVLILPILGASVIVYARTFAGSDWVDYRVQSETLRSNIYIYRFKKHYQTSAEMLTQTREDFSQSIRDVSEALANLSNPTLIADTSPESVIGRVRAGQVDLNPLAPITIDQYVQQRAIPARDWYLARLSNDKTNLQYYFILGQVVTIFGAILTGYDLTLLVAITAAISTALGLNSDLTMYGRTYGLFYLTHTKLENAILEYEANRPLYNSVEEAQKFVDSVEEILFAERDSWGKLTKQIQGQFENKVDASVLKKTAGEDTIDVGGNIPATVVQGSPVLVDKKSVNEKANEFD